MQYDLAVIGAGWAGFNAALKARKSGLRVALIEKGDVGGTCLNRGCIPTKTLLQSAKIYSLAKKSSVFGVSAQDVSFDLLQIQARKERLMQQLRQAMSAALSGVDYIRTKARIVSRDRIELDPAGTIDARFILVATGSRPMELGGLLKFKPGKVLSSDEILNLKELPKSLLIIGAGAIGCEFASLFSSLGVKVSIVEKMNQLLPGEDSEVAKKLENIFKKKGIGIALGAEAGQGHFDAHELALLCVGRSADTQGLGLEELGVSLERGRICVDKYLRTGIPNIYAAGDCAAGIPMLAHAASFTGRLAAQNIISSNTKEYSGADIPACIFTDPEIAGVGARKDDPGRQEVYKFDFLGSGMARILDETAGFIKIIADKNTQEIAGASIIGPKATELIGILTLARSQRLKVGELKQAVFAHPSLAEAISESLESHA